MSLYGWTDKSEDIIHITVVSQISNICQKRRETFFFVVWLPACLPASSVCVFGRVSYLVCCLYHMPGRTTRKCKETLLQVRERQANERTSKQNKEQS